MQRFAGVDSWVDGQSHLVIGGGDDDKSEDGTEKENEMEKESKRLKKESEDVPVPQLPARFVKRRKTAERNKRKTNNSDAPVFNVHPGEEVKLGSSRARIPSELLTVGVLDTAL